MNIFLEFFKPYFVFLFTGGHSLIEVSSVLNLITTSNGIYLYDRNFFNFYLGFYSIFVLIVILFQLYVSFSISKKFTYISFCFWLLPGILQVLNIVDFNINGPIVFTYGGTLVPNVYGILINAFVVTVFTWSLIILITHIFKLGKKFKLGFDHIWYLFGLFALIFFMLEYKQSTNNERIKSVEKNFDESVEILKSNTKTVKKYCELDKFKEDFENVCKYISPLNKQLEDILFKKKYMLISESELNFNELFKKNKLDKKLLDNEVLKLNDYCNTVKDVANKCISVPFHMNKDPSFLKAEKFPFDKYFLSTPALIPYIEDIWQEYYKLYMIQEENKKLPYKRWFFFMLLAAVTGIKLALTTREIFPVIESSIYRINIKKAISFLISCPRNNNN